MSKKYEDLSPEEQKKIRMERFTDDCFKNVTFLDRPNVTRAELLSGSNKRSQESKDKD